MGVQISEILPKKPILMEDLKGKKIAIDAFNWIYQFLSIIRDRETGEPLKDSKGRITSHLSGLFYRTAKLMQSGIKPIYVFDGPPPEFKYVIEERNKIKIEALARLKEAIAKGETEEIRIASQMSSRLTEEMIEQSKSLLTYMGIPAFQAPSEGEAQCAFLCKENLVYSTASQDSDSLLFGSTRLIRNLNITGKRKLPKRNIFIDVNPELIELKKVLDSIKLTRQQLIIVGILIGTDYNPGIRGIGPKKAIDLVKKEKTLKKVLGEVEWNTDTPAETIFDFYMHPPAKKFEIKFGEVNRNKLLKMLVDEHEFSPERIEKAIKTIRESKEYQKNLGSWFK